MRWQHWALRAQLVRLLRQAWLIWLPWGVLLRLVWVLPSRQRRLVLSAGLLSYVHIGQYGRLQAALWDRCSSCTSAGIPAASIVGMSVSHIQLYCYGHRS